MILPDHEIRKALKEGSVVIEPLDDPEVQIQPAWVDLSLGSEFRIFKHKHEPYIDIKDPKEYTEKMDTGDKPLILHPGEFVLGITKERVKIPPNLAAYVDGKSSLGRLGVTAHITSGWVDPGFSGKLVLEISNLGKMPITIYPGMRVCKLVLFKLSSPVEKHKGERKDSKYMDQDSISESKLHQEKF